MLARMQQFILFARLLTKYTVWILSPFSFPSPPCNDLCTKKTFFLQQQEQLIRPLSTKLQASPSLKLQVVGVV